MEVLRFSSVYSCMMVEPCDVDGATCAGCVCERSLYCKNTKTEKKMILKKPQITLEGQTSKLG